MSARKTPIPGSPPDEQQRLQRFLEIAAPLLLDRAAPDEEVWPDLLQLAHSVGMTEDELRQVLNSLRQEGVLPGEAGESQPASRALVDVDFEACLTASGIGRVPTPPMPPPPPPRRRDAAVGTRFRTSDPTDERSLREATVPVRAFVQKVEPIVAEHGGLTAEARVLLASLAHSAGLSEWQFDQAMRALGGTSEIVPPPTPDVPRHEPLPAERFCRYLHSAIEEKRRTRGYLSESAERKLVDEGVRKLSLSPVYARHLVREVAGQCGVAIVAQDQAADDDAANPCLEQFIARASPIIAQQRGFTAQARMLLAAIARELEMSEPAMKAGIELLQDSWDRTGPSNQQPQERRESLRAFLLATLQTHQQSVLTPPEIAELTRIGHQLHGVEPDAAAELVREVAAAHGMRLVTAEQACRHVTLLAAEWLDSEDGLSESDEQRLLKEGAQWGIGRAEVRALIDAARRDAVVRRRRQRQLLIASIVVGSVLTVTLMGAFFRYALRMPAPAAKAPATIGVEGREAQGGGTTETTSTSPSAAQAPEVRAVSWWTDVMRIAWVNARRQLSEAELTALVALESDDPASRGRAYERLVDMALVPGNSGEAIRPLTELATRCVASDPDDSAAAAWLKRWSGYLPDQGAKIPDDPQLHYPQMLEAIRLAVAASSQADIASTRHAQISDAIMRKLPAVAAAGTSAPDVQRQYQAELLRRVFRNLILAVKDLSPELMERHLAVLQPLIVRHLDQNEVARLSVDLLRVALPAAGEQWRHLEPLLMSAVFSEDPVSVVRMADIYEDMDDGPARKYLASLLLSRAEVPFEKFESLDDVPELVREALGVSPELVYSHEDQVAAYVSESEELLGRAATPPAEQADMAEMILRVARQGTIGMALARRDAATVAALRSAPRVETVSSPEVFSLVPSAAAEEGPVTSLTPLRTEQVRQAAQLLRGSSSAWQRRGQALGLICVAAESNSSALGAEVADATAKYLLSERYKVEHSRRLMLLPRLRHWDLLRLALAAELAELAPGEQQPREIMASYLERPLRDFDTTAPADAPWTRQVRIELLREALERLPDESARDSDGDVTSLRDVQNQLKEQYLKQAQILGMAGESLAAATTPAEIRRAMIEHFAATLAERKDIADRTLLEEIPHRLAAAEYVAPNDLALTVMLDHLWLRLLAWDHDLRGGTGEVARPIITQMEDADRHATGLLDQLLSRQAGLVRLTLLEVRGE